jgi:hypothetical protein
MVMLVAAVIAVEAVNKQPWASCNCTKYVPWHKLVITDPETAGLTQLYDTGKFGEVA